MSSSNNNTPRGGDYTLAGYDLLNEGDDYVMYRHHGTGRKFRIWKSAMPVKGTRMRGSSTSVRDDNNNNSQIDNSLNEAMSTITTGLPSNQIQQGEQQRYTGSYAEFIKDKQKAAKAAYLQMRHEMIERAVQERKRDIESRTVTLRDGRRAILPRRRNNEAVINMLANGSKYDDKQ